MPRETERHRKKQTLGLREAVRKPSHGSQEHTPEESQVGRESPRGPAVTQGMRKKRKTPGEGNEEPSMKRGARHRHPRFPHCPSLRNNLLQFFFSRDLW